MFVLLHHPPALCAPDIASTLYDLYQAAHGVQSCWDTRTEYFDYSVVCSVGVACFDGKGGWVPWGGGFGRVSVRGSPRHGSGPGPLIGFDVVEDVGRASVRRKPHYGDNFTKLRWRTLFPKDGAATSLN